jgi:hypothetical protein
VSTTLADNDLVPKGTYVGVYNATDDNIKIISQVGAAGGGGNGLGFTYTGNMGSSGIPASTTEYKGLGETAWSTTEAIKSWMVPATCTAKNLYIRMTSTQTATGSAVFTIRKNAVDTALVVTITAGATAATFSNTSDTVAFSAGDRMVLKAVNNGTATGGLLNEFALQCN